MPLHSSEKFSQEKTPKRPDLEANSLDAKPYWEQELPKIFSAEKPANNDPKAIISAAEYQKKKSLIDNMSDFLAKFEEGEIFKYNLPKEKVRDHLLSSERINQFIKFIVDHYKTSFDKIRQIFLDVQAYEVNPDYDSSLFQNTVLVSEEEFLELQEKSRKTRQEFENKKQRERTEIEEFMAIRAEAAQILQPQTQTQARAVESKTNSESSQGVMRPEKINPKNHAEILKFSTDIRNAISDATAENDKSASEKNEETLEDVLKEFEHSIQEASNERQKIITEEFGADLQASQKSKKSLNPDQKEAEKRQAETERERIITAEMQAIVNPKILQNHFRKKDFQSGLNKILNMAAPMSFANETNDQEAIEGVLNSYSALNWRTMIFFMQKLQDQNYAEQLQIFVKQNYGEDAQACLESIKWLSKEENEDRITDLLQGKFKVRKPYQVHSPFQDPYGFNTIRRTSNETISGVKNILSDLRNGKYENRKPSEEILPKIEKVIQRLQTKLEIDKVARSYQELELISGFMETATKEIALQISSIETELKRREYQFTPKERHEISQGINSTNRLKYKARYISENLKEYLKQIDKNGAPTHNPDTENQAA